MEDGILMPQVFENGTKKIDEFKGQQTLLMVMYLFI